MDNFSGKPICIDVSNKQELIDLFYKIEMKFFVLKLIYKFTKKNSRIK